MLRKVMILFVSLLLSLIINGYRVESFEGDSMSPTIEGDYLITRSSLNYYNGDVVVLEKNSLNLVKRIKASEGDKIRSKEGYLYINDSKTGHKILSRNFNQNLNKNEYFVLSDNKNRGLDSTLLGVVKEENIKGKVIFIIDTQVVKDILGGVTDD